MNLIDCNLALKGGVTSGLVHAGAVPELARHYRFLSVAGSSAGAIAAAFTAGAEYARSRGDDDGFMRLSQHSAELPSRLLGLFQPSPGLDGLARALVHLAPGTGRARVISAILCFWPALLTGFLSGVAAWLLLAGHTDFVRRLIGGLILGTCGAAVGLGLQTAIILRRVARLNFGICSGLSRESRPALTDWLHDCLQDIAFGRERDRAPLTFGDLENAGIDLRIVATNLSTGRGEITPDLGRGYSFRPAEWARQFPEAVMAHLTHGRSDAVLSIPSTAELPVLVALRMSLACPGLLEATPAIGEGGARVWFSDGGLTTNFPFGAFDEDTRPTLALDLDTIQPGQTVEPRVRVFDPATDNSPPDLITLRGFAWSLLVALREGHLRTAARRPERTAHIYQARLRPDEGGMNLDMTAAEAVALMKHGAELGALVIKTELTQTP